MSEYDKAFSELNTQQRKAVEAIDGPLLVIAGPGTGKTQLLATRVGYILKNTDTLPQNILCLTFTEAGVFSMRERLTKLLGQAAYDVQISTYHAFGSDLLRRYPEYTGSYDFEPIDELGADSLIREILSAAPYSNPLKSAVSYARDLRQFMEECKRALLKPTDIKNLAQANLDYIDKASPIVSESLKDFKRIDKSATGLFEQLYDQLKTVSVKSTSKTKSLKQMCIENLAGSIQLTADSGKTKELTAWKNAWLEKNSEGQFILGGELANKKIMAAAEIYSLYQELLKKRKLFDYSDMILRAITALEKHPDFKFTLAEKYQYILLDEFQDTNPSQFRLVELLTDNPVNEGRPNVMAVGDDDQAIYAFQGADHANMYRFSNIYRDVRVLSLRDNYRSHGDILDVAYNLSSQISERLHESFSGITKILMPATPGKTSTATITHARLESDAVQYAWVADKVAKLASKENVPLSEIAILAPKHRYLIPLIPYLATKNLPIRYEKKENILDKQLVRQLEQMSRLILAYRDRNQPLINSLWPEILSYDHWGIETEQIWLISLAADKSGGDWTNTLLLNEQTLPIAEFFLRLKDLLPLTTLEQQLDMITGTNENDPASYNLPIRSPFFEYYFGSNKARDWEFLALLSDLSVLRGKLRNWTRTDDRPYNLSDFISFIDAHRTAEINILNTSPHFEAKEAINLMTAYQAKGREFKAVFIVAAQDEVWGAASLSARSNLSLPPNLSYIRYQGASDDERLRLLYVALTRAKTHLFLTSYASTADGKNTRDLKYLTDQPSLSPITAHPISKKLTIDDLQNYWHQRHTPPLSPKLTDLLEPDLQRYQLSPTHLNQFVDIINGGPESFFLNTVLRFPKGQSPSAAYGSAIHETLNWLHAQIVEPGTKPLLSQAVKYFKERLKKHPLSLNDNSLMGERGQECLEAFYAIARHYSTPSDRSEVNFRNEGVFVGDAHLSGKVDRLLIDNHSKTITVVDFKTGKSHDRWRPDVLGLHKYRQQLLFYKLLVEGSHTYAGYKVGKGVLVFVEPNSSGKITTLELDIDTSEVEELKKLIASVWNNIKKLEFPKTHEYPQNIKGIKRFEHDLIKNSRD